MIGAKVGPYEVSALLGRGGMGEVYRASDARLERDVALKLLPPELATDAERLARFEREARLLASLQHQNIAAIFGIEQHDGRPVLVMELAEGDDLSVKMGGGALPADEVEKLTKQLAAGLEYAHEQGIVHRDLKPANIKIGADGALKILDFGLARAFDGPAGSAVSGQAADNLTLSQGLTMANTVIGTAAYMSPEQARGYEVDRRADIWAFGVVVWEMLTGQRLFAGETSSDILAAVLRQDPDWTQMPDDAPPLLVQLCRRCLERDPQLRLRDIGEARIALGGSGSSMVGLRTEAMAAASPGEISGSSSRLPWLVAGAALVAAVVLGGLGFSGRLGPQPEPAPQLRATVVLEEGQGLQLNPGNPGAPVISPDGRKLAFAFQDTSGGVMLGVRALDSDVVRTIPGTAGAAYLFWAPDSRRVGFFANGQLNTVDIAGGPVVPVCRAENAKSGSWHANDRILFTPSHGSPIFVVPAAGGEPVAVTDAESDPNFRSHRFPHWLPDGHHFLYLAWFRNDAGRTGASSELMLRLGDVDGNTSRDLMPTQTGGAYVSGHIIYIHESNLMARPFSLDALDFSGPPRPVIGDVLDLGAAHYGVFSAASEEADVLAYVGSGGTFGDARLAWVEGADKVPVIDRSGAMLGISLSPDGKRIAMSRIDENQGSFDIWVHDIERALATRVTYDSDSEMGPLWSPDGRWIAYVAEEEGLNVIKRQPADGGGRPEVLVKMEVDLILDSFGPEGRLVSLTKSEPGGRFSVWLAEVGGEAPRIFSEVPFNMGNSRIAPDGKWLAYISDETGSFEVFVEAMNRDGGRWRVSAQGASLPVWSPAGDQLYYLDATGKVQATEIVATADGIAIGRTHAVTNGVVAGIYPTYAVDRSSGRLLVQVPAHENLNNRIEIVTNWQRLLEADTD